MRTVLSRIWKRRYYFRFLIPVLLLLICLFGLVTDPLSTSANAFYPNIAMRHTATTTIPAVPTITSTNSIDPTPAAIPTGIDITPPSSTDVNPNPEATAGNVTPDPVANNTNSVSTTTVVPAPTEPATSSHASTPTSTIHSTPTSTSTTHPTPTQTAQKPAKPCPSPTNTPQPAQPAPTQPVQGPLPTVTATPTGTSTATATPTETPTGTDASGQAMPTGDLPGWHQVFSEDFNTNVPTGSFPGTAYGNKFSVYPDDTPDTAGQQGAPSRYYPSKVVSVSDGLLNLHLHSENGTPMAAAILPTLPGNHLYGKYTIRFRSDALPGFKTAWLLWPDSGAWPRDGEIDFPEGDLSGQINAFVHHQDATSDSDQDAYNTQATFTSWHTASIEWTPNKVVFMLDDRVIGTSTERVPNTPMHWVIQTESCFDGCPAASTEGNLQIAWVVAYAQAS